MTIFVFRKQPKLLRAAKNKPADWAKNAPSSKYTAKK